MGVARTLRGRGARDPAGISRPRISLPSSALGSKRYARSCTKRPEPSRGPVEGTALPRHGRDEPGEGPWGDKDSAPEQARSWFPSGLRGREQRAHLRPEPAELLM